MLNLLIGILICSYSLMFWIINLNIIIIENDYLKYLAYSLTHFSTLSIFLGIITILRTLKKFKK